MELKTKVTKDTYTDYLERTFDLSISDFATTRIPELKQSKLPSEWSIGVICGASGSGKSTILRTLGEIKEPTFDNSISVLSNFAPMPPSEATMLLSSMGLASVPVDETILHPLERREIQGDRGENRLRIRRGPH